MISMHCKNILKTIATQCVNILEDITLPLDDNEMSIFNLSLFTMEEEVQSCYDLLITRSGETYNRQHLNDIDDGSKKKKKPLFRKKSYLLCKVHAESNKDKWTVESEECFNCINFSRGAPEFKNGKLPLKGDIISYILSCQQSDLEEDDYKHGN